MGRELGILSKADDDVVQSSLEVTPQYSNHTQNKRTRVDSELVIYYRYEAGYHVELPLAFWIKKCQD